MKKISKSLILRARNMRQEATDAEKRLWYKINKKQLGVQFRRQHLVENKYIVDFVCLEKKLVVEIDGGQHSENLDDEIRTNFLQQKGFKVIRFWNNEILQNMENCVEVILKEIILKSIIVLIVKVFGLIKVNLNY